MAYLEQTLSELLVKAMVELESYRGQLKHPALSIEESAKAFVSLFLKAHNPQSESHIRARQTARLAEFLRECSVAEQINAAPRGGGVFAAKRSPRLPQLEELGEQYDKLASESRETLFNRLFRPTAPTLGASK
jgi:adenylate/nucleoside-diphosphate kinase